MVAGTPPPFSQPPRVNPRTEGATNRKPPAKPIQLNQTLVDDPPRRTLNAPPRAKPKAPPAFAVATQRETETGADHYVHRLERKGPIGRALEWLFHKQPSWLTSFFVHLVLILVLAVLFVPIKMRQAITLELGPVGADTAEIEEISFEEPMEAPEVEPDEAVVEPVLIETMPMEEPALVDLNPPIQIVEVADMSVGGDAASTTTSVPSTPGGISNRVGRRTNAQQLGASVESEAAVDNALAWLAAHQNYDGSWNFNAKAGRCKGKCRHSGSGVQARNGATALGLLPFLGAGNTARSGKYKKTVASGLNFLMKQQRKDGGFTEPQGNMYSHGLAALALCEAAALEVRDKEGYSSQDRSGKQKLRKAAQKAIDFIVYSQHSGGGWRYQPRQAGDTSVVGWQAMALQSGRLAKLTVRQKTMDGITRFLNSVGSGQYGHAYGYMSPGARPGTSAIGLLCRMYLGWDRTHPGISNGAEYLHRMGPSSNNVYYDYYATQVMHHYQGPMWERWNGMLRDHLVDTQVKRGHEAGSWYFAGDHGSSVGGRLYVTAMATMTLEVYYRHMPIYSQEAVNDHAPMVGGDDDDEKVMEI